MDASVLRLVADLQAKLARADKHLEELRRTVKAWGAEPPHVFRTEREPERGRWVAYLVLTEPPPAELSVIVGDLGHNWRSALDHFACGMLPTITRRSCFPIYDDADEFTHGVTLLARNKRHRFTNRPFRSRASVRTIERAQTYHGQHGPKFHPLYSLRRLSNEDKHRAILARAIAVADDPMPQAAIRRTQDIEVPEQFWVHTGATA